MYMSACMYDLFMVFFLLLLLLVFGFAMIMFYFASPFSNTHFPSFLYAFHFCLLLLTLCAYSVSSSVPLPFD